MTNGKEELSVLVVEDNEELLSLAMSALDGFHTYGALNAVNGFNKFKKLCPDITFVDIGLPDKDGLELLGDMIAYDPEAFIVMLTASNLSSDVEMAKKLGAVGYIVKPFTRRKLQECKNQYFTHRRKLASASSLERAENIANKLQASVEGKYKTSDAVFFSKATTSNKENKGQDIEQLTKAAKPKTTEKEVLTAQELIRQWNILFADDYFINRDHAEKGLSKLGCNVYLAEDGKEAMSLYTNTGFAVVFLDAHMPDMSGYEVAMAIREKEKEEGLENSIIIGMIDSVEEAESKNWLQAGMNEYVIKPANFAYLRGIIVKYARKHIFRKKLYV